jgi:hypothetical protein
LMSAGDGAKPARIHMSKSPPQASAEGVE